MYREMDAKFSDQESFFHAILPAILLGYKGATLASQSIIAIEKEASI